MLLTSSSESFSLLFWIEATALVQEDCSRSLANTRASRRFRYAPSVGSAVKGIATDLKSIRRRMFSSNASQLAGVAFGECVISILGFGFGLEGKIYNPKSKSRLIKKT